MKNTTISVIVPVYNVEKYLDECILSIISQTYRDIEIILIDDGSTDESGTICDKYLDDKRVCVYHNANQGVTAARLYGVSQSKGNWICFVDSDDTIPSRSIEKLYKEAETELYDIIIGYEKPLIKRSMVVEKEEYRHGVIQHKAEFPNSLCGKLYRRSLFGQSSLGIYIPKEVIKGEDMLMNIILSFRVTKKILLIPQTTYNYRRGRTGSVITSFSANINYETTFYGLVKQSIPVAMLDDFCKDLIIFRLKTLQTIYFFTRNIKWRGSDFYKELIKDLSNCRKQIRLSDRIITTVFYPMSILFFVAKNIKNKLRFLLCKK